MFEMFQMIQYKFEILSQNPIVAYDEILKNTRFDFLQISDKFATKLQTVYFKSDFCCVILIEKQPPQIEQLLT